MPVPPFHEFIDPLLRYLGGHPDGVPKGDANQGAADAVHLSDVDRAEMIPSGGQLLFDNRIGWAHDRLKRAGLSSCPQRGFWKITPDGVALLAKYPQALPREKVLQIASRRTGVAADGGGGNGSIGMSDVQPLVDLETDSPLERMESALQDLRESAAHELLDLVGQGTPLFFENLVLDLLHAMGYGTSRTDLQRVGGKGDGGIDGIISLDRLGLEKVYVQAKRWQGSVGSSEIRGFVGALQLQGANKGVFMTTGIFTRDALDTADRARGSVVLVDGQRLATLMIEHGVGVTYKEFKVPKMDGDYFEGA